MLKLGSQLQIIAYSRLEFKERGITDAEAQQASDPHERIALKVSKVW